MGFRIPEPGEDAQRPAEVPRSVGPAMIFVSGANGQFARAVIRNVLAVAPASSLVVGSRDVSTPFARELAAKGVHVRPADYRQPELMRSALVGVTKALFIPTYDTND